MESLSIELALDRPLINNLVIIFVIIINLIMVQQSRDGPFSLMTKELRFRKKWPWSQDTNPGLLDSILVLPPHGSRRRTEDKLKTQDKCVEEPGLGRVCTALGPFVK